MLSRAAHVEMMGRICTVPWGLHLILVTCRAPDCAPFDRQCQGPLAYSGGVGIRLEFYVGILALPLGGGRGAGGQWPLGRVWFGTDHRSIKLLCADFRSVGAWLSC